MWDSGKGKEGEGRGGEGAQWVYGTTNISIIMNQAYCYVLIPTLIVLENAVCVSQLNTTIFVRCPV